MRNSQRYQTFIELGDVAIAAVSSAIAKGGTTQFTAENGREYLGSIVARQVAHRKAYRRAREAEQKRETAKYQARKRARKRR